MLATARRTARACAQAWTTRTSADALVEYYVRRRQDAGGMRAFAVRHPVQTALAAAAIARLPAVEVPLTESAEGRAIRAALTGRGVGGMSLAATGLSVLDVPPTTASVAAWAHKRAIRRKVKPLVAAGATVTAVDDVHERRALLALGDEVERTHPDERYRLRDPDTDHLLERSLWFVTRTADGQPLVLAIGAVDGQWCVLDYMRVLGHGQEHSAARYLVLQRVVEHAQRTGVRHIMTNSSPGGLTSGLLHFQRMTGWRLVRARLRVTGATDRLARAGADPRG